MKTLNLNDKQNIAYCISNDLRDAQIKINLKKVSGRFSPDEKLKPDRVAIVCFGPSLEQTWEQLRDFDKIITCSGAHKFLIDKGIIPTWHADLDPRAHKITMLGDPSLHTEYLIASTIHPLYFDKLEGMNVKLWHIFANDDDAVRILPKGEWKFTGGSSIGLRCFTLMRAMGYTDLHVFGMDGSFGPGGESHTTAHPNAPKEQYETEYNGKKYLTTPSIAHCAVETFHEMDQMKDCRFTFYGEGLVQDMSKDYIRKPKKFKSDIAYIHAELISEEKRELDAKLHRDHPTYGMGGAKHADRVRKLCIELKTTKVLDYGCGKGMLAKSLQNDFPIWQYDPAIPEHAGIPGPADIVVCTDVLEHIEPDKLRTVLEDIARCTLKVGYFVISTRKAVKTYANGQNTHSIVQGKGWWTKQMEKFFNVADVNDHADASELHFIVGPRLKDQVPNVSITEINSHGYKVKFYTPNGTTKWRAETLFTKEPSTIKWIDEMKKGDVLYDIGANIGSYTVLAGSKGVKVYAFEPEAENFALLTKNLQINNLDPNALQVAISDHLGIGVLYLGQKEVGGACHSFDAEVGPDLSERKAAARQGCLSITLDRLQELGLPTPDHLKIDVDGFEHKVIDGAIGILANGIKSILIEINPAIPEHVEMVTRLSRMGFEFDPVQVEAATRKDGPFKGCAEYIFYKTVSTPLIKHVVKRIQGATLVQSPFPYVYVTHVFTDNVFNKMIDNLPKQEEYIEIEKSRGTKGYPKRFTGWNDHFQHIADQLLTGELKRAIFKKFNIADGDHFTEDFILIRDEPGYSIAPHTDSLTKVISVLFYLPDILDIGDEGTRIYVPKNKNFECTTGRHYDFESFNEVALAPFVPNSALMFERTNKSFHGVPPCKNVRNVLLYNIKTKIKSNV